MDAAATAAATAGYVIRNSWAGRSVGRALLVLGLAVCVYQAYRRWRMRRNLQRLAGKVVLITGASSGLGEALARLFHSAGAKVILASRNAQQLQRIKFQLENDRVQKLSSTPRHSPKVVVLDLSDSSSIPERAQEALDAFGRVDILVNNAGISSRGSVMDTQVEVDRRVMEVNFFGAVSLTKALLPSMLEQQGGGHIVVVSSLQGKIALPLRSSYCASKHALQGYFDSLRVELAPRGISVTVVSPGYIHTQLSVNAVRGDGSKYGATDPSTAHGMSAEYAAHHVLQAVASRERECVLAPPHHRLNIYVRVFCPSLLDWLLRFRAASAS